MISVAPKRELTLNYNINDVKHAIKETMRLPQFKCISQNDVLGIYTSGVVKGFWTGMLGITINSIDESNTKCAFEINPSVGGKSDAGILAGLMDHFLDTFSKILTGQIKVVSPPVAEQKKGCMMLFVWVLFIGLTGIFGLFVACNTTPTVTNNNDSLTAKSKYSKEFINEEQDKVIGNVLFSMDSVTAERTLSEFRKSTERHIANGLPSGEDREFLGNFKVSTYYTHFHNGHLYDVEIIGYPINSDNYYSADDIADDAAALINAKYKQPDDSTLFPLRSNLSKGYFVKLFTWKIGKKEIIVSVNQSEYDWYYVGIRIYQPEVEKQIENEYQVQKDSIEKATKDIF